MTDRRTQSEALLHDQISQLWNRQVAAAALNENENGLDNLSRLILRALRRSGPVRSSEAASSIGLSRAAISRRVSWLESEGLVRSQPDPADGRASLLSLTPAGEARLDELDTTGAHRMRELTADFTADEIEALANLLARFNARASAHSDMTKKRTNDNH